MAAGAPGADEDQDAAAATGTVPERSGRAPAIRPFLLTAGRVADAGTALPLETQVVATAEALAVLDTLTFEPLAIVSVCRRPQSLAEIAAHLCLHLNVVRVLAEDLRVQGHLAVYEPDTRTAQDPSILQRVIDGLLAIPDSPA
ncbi:DUF742 domain-containing protein [Streptomyces sp. NPDC006638]|uniref:DUF742 domain-containing protein n=1 Tax=unclassified Streptomyces TaxID=2593676 RepID=UPI00339E2ED9